MFASLLTLACLTQTTVPDAPPKIIGETTVAPHRLCRLSAESVDPKSAILWRVYPRVAIDRATTDSRIFEFVAPPGTYDVEMLVISQDGDGGFVLSESFTRVTFQGKKEEPPGDGTKPPPDTPKPSDPIQALGRIRFGNAGCTATIIGPRRSDGRWDILTAAHCVSGVGARGSMTLKDGRTLGITIVVHQRGPDLAWAVTDDATLADLPWVKLATGNPPVGTKVWHAGYGVDRPTNREDGEIAANEDGNGQLRMILSVSSGDSGGGIFRTDTNEVISTVCCTSGMARRVSMWGASTRAIVAARPKAVDGTEHNHEQQIGDWNPLPIPIRQSPDELSDEWKPLPIPIREDTRTVTREPVVIEER